jgi:hypothetical protein
MHQAAVTNLLLILVGMTAGLGCKDASTSAKTTVPEIAPVAQSPKAEARPALGKQDIDDDLVDAVFRCEPRLVCGSLSAATLTRFQNGQPRYELTPKTRMKFARRDGAEVRILSEEEKGRVLSSDSELMYLVISLEWQRADAATVSLGAGELSREAVERAKHGRGTGIACGGGTYGLHREQGVWTCDVSPPPL